MTFNKKYQRGVSLGGLIVVLIVLAMIGLTAAKVVPAYSEYASIKNAIATASSLGSVREIQASFDKQSMVTGVTAIRGSDLEIVKNGDKFEISFAYEKKIPLAGNVSLLIDFAGVNKGGAAQ